MDYVTNRGFCVYADLPTEGGNFTVQESSLATERRVWVGLGDKRGHLNEAEARRIRDALSEFVDGGA